MDIGQRIKAMRKEAGLTQAQLAQSVGLSTIAIRQYESGVRCPKYETVEKIAKAMKCDISSLLSTSEEATMIIDELIKKLSANENSSQKTSVQNEFTKAYNDSILREKAYSEFSHSSRRSESMKYPYADGMYLAYLSGIGITPPDVESLISVGFEPSIAFCIFHLLGASQDVKKEFIEMLQYVKEADDDAPQDNP